MKILALEDLKDKSHADIIQHLIDCYSGKESGGYGYPTDEDKKDAARELKGKEILIAYESTGDYGCDSSSFFLLKDKKTGQLFEVHGSHCSCYGFEGQLNLESTTVEALRFRREKSGSIFSTGGYDSGGYEDKKNHNQIAVNEYIDKLK